MATISTAINEQAATKDDIKVVRVDLKSDIKAMQEKLEHVQEKLEHTATKTDLELLSKSMTIRLGLMLFAVAAVMIALFNATN